MPIVFFTFSDIWNISQWVIWMKMKICCNDYVVILLSSFVALSDICTSCHKGLMKNLSCWNDFYIDHKTLK